MNMASWLTLPKMGAEAVEKPKEFKSQVIMIWC